jgi:UTP--glucose-1-phosphate uridylyltransferase
VRDEWSFLELAARQILKLRENYGSPVPWLLMNSFHTREDSLAVLSSYPLTVQGLPLDFLQSKVPRIDRATALPTDFENPEDNWAPPGHGDIFFSLWTSRLLDDLLQRGIRWAFISNIDNLGATVVPHILGYLDHQGLEFAMEVADKSLADIKGGTLIRHQGRLTLLESAQVENSHIQEFQDINVFSVFNSNNLWVRLDTLRDILEHQHLELPMIINPKMVQGREIIQLETAMGAAISNFSHAVGIRIPRSRFIPVKTTDDLLAVRSDAYVLEEDFSLGPNPARSTHLGPPIIQLDPRYYMGIEDFEARIPYPLSLLQCRRLTVEGDIYFGEKVRIEGDVTLTNKLAQSTIIPDSTLFHSGHHSV